MAANGSIEQRCGQGQLSLREKTYLFEKIKYIVLHTGQFEYQSTCLQQSEAVAAQKRAGRRRLAPFNDGTVRVFHDVIDTPDTADPVYP